MKYVCIVYRILFEINAFDLTYRSVDNELSAHQYPVSIVFKRWAITNSHYVFNLFFEDEISFFIEYGFHEMNTTQYWPLVRNM